MEEKSSKFCKCLYYSSNTLARIVTKMADEEFARTGLTTSFAFLVMSVVEQPGIQPMDLSKIMMLNPSTITRLIEKLEQKGLVSRETEGKFTRIYPTEAGREMEPVVKECWMNFYKRYTKTLSETHANLLTVSIYDAAMKLDKI